MLTNGFLKNKVNFKVGQKIQKAILTGIGATTSKEVIKKAAIGLYDDVQKIIHDLLNQLERKGKLKAKETKRLIKEFQKKSEIEKPKIYKKLEKEGRSLLNTAKDIIVTPFAIAKSVTSSVKNSKRPKFKKGSTRRKKK